MVIPTREGVVVAADSRTTVAGKYFDNREKLHFLKGDPSVAFALTGTSEFIPFPPLGVNLRKWVDTAEPEFEGSQIIASHLESNWNGELSDESLRQIATAFGKAVYEFYVRRPNALRPFLGKDLCRFVMIQFDAGS